jgi:hypothetical protein
LVKKHGTGFLKPAEKLVPSIALGYRFWKVNTAQSLTSEGTRASAREGVRKISGQEGEGEGEGDLGERGK